ncbi:MAG TPA: tetratricopeptide repeat protein, partial [Candidatus Krumholzibacterium sp.]|nr:tetratricopeptide repeat protein [Candidatus Krumholzibacterium sp.]
MRGKEKKRGTALAAVICSAIVVLGIVFAGCGGDSTGESGYRTIKKETVTAAKGDPGDQAVARVEKVESFDDEMASIEEEAQAAEPTEVTYEEAEAAYLARNYGEAAKMFEVYTANKTENPWGYYMLGLSAWKAGDFGKAEGAFKLAIDLDPKHLKSHIN